MGLSVTADTTLQISPFYSNKKCYLSVEDRKHDSRALTREHLLVNTSKRIQEVVLGEFPICMNVYCIQPKCVLFCFMHYDTYLSHIIIIHHNS